MQHPLDNTFMPSSIQAGLHPITLHKGATQKLLLSSETLYFGYHSNYANEEFDDVSPSSGIAEHNDAAEIDHYMVKSTYSLYKYALEQGKVIYALNSPLLTDLYNEINLQVVNLQGEPVLIVPYSSTQSVNKQFDYVDGYFIFSAEETDALKKGEYKYSIIGTHNTDMGTVDAYANSVVSPQFIHLFFHGKLTVV